MRGKYQIVVAIWLLQVVNYLDRVVIGFAGPSMMQSLQIEPKTFGVLLSSFAVGYFVSQIPGGMIADRCGVRPMLIIGPLFWALFTGLTGLVASVAALIVVRLCFGMAEGVANAATYKVIGDSFDAKGRARAVSVWVTAFALAPALAGPAVGMLVVSYGWQPVFLLLAIPALAVSLVNYVLIPAAKPVGAANALADALGRNGPLFRDLLREPSLWLVASAFGFWNIAYWGFLGWMPSYLALQRHIDLKASGVLGGIPYLFGLVGGVAPGWLGCGLLLRHRPQFLAALYGFGAVSLYFAYASATLTGSIAALSCTAACIYGGLSMYGTIVLDLAPETMRAAYSGIVSTIGQVGAVLAPVLIGYLISETGSFASGFVLMGAALCLGAVCALALVPLRPARRLLPRVVPAPQSEARGHHAG